MITTLSTTKISGPIPYGGSPQAGHRTRQPLFTTDRIFPTFQETREAIIATHFDEDDQLQQEANNDADSGDCLVRVYLGERETPRQQAGGSDALRKNPAAIEHDGGRGVDNVTIAKEMAIGLTTLYKRAQVDEEVWDWFCARYLEASELVLRDKGVDEGTRRLPWMFLDGVVRVSRENEGGSEEDSIVFAV